jgi:hypothetical protein
MLGSLLTAKINLILDGWTVRKGISSIQNKKKAKRSLEVIPALSGRWLAICHHELPKMHLKRTPRSCDPKYDWTPNLLQSFSTARGGCGELLPDDGHYRTNPDKEELTVHSKYASSQYRISDMILCSRSAECKSY